MSSTHNVECRPYTILQIFYPVVNQIIVLYVDSKSISLKSYDFTKSLPQPITIRRAVIYILEQQRMPNDECTALHNPIHTVHTYMKFITHCIVEYGSNQRRGLLLGDGV